MRETKIVLTAILTLLMAKLSYANDIEGRDNYVELGQMKEASSFKEVSPSELTEGFSIPIFKKSDYVKQAVQKVDPPAAKDISANRKRVRKSAEVLYLENKLKAIRIIPIPKFSFGKEALLENKKIGWSSSNYKVVKSFSLKRGDIPSIFGELKKIRDEVQIKSANLRTINVKNVDIPVIDISKVEAVVYAPDYPEEFEPIVMNLKEDKDLELLAADILFTEQESCEEVVPLTYYLGDKKTKDHRVSFYKGYCLHQAEMFSESIPLLAEAIGKGSDYYAKEAVGAVLKGLPKGYESIVSESLAPKNVYNKLEQDQKDRYNYILAKGNFVKDKFKRSEAHAKLVSPDAKDYYDAKFLSATSSYMNGRIQSGIKILLELKNEYPSQDAKDPFKSLIHMTLGRFLFERGAYKEAIAEYEQVSREHPLWIDSLVEKGWAQVKVKDYKGALGNMYTMQSPLFNEAFIPESHVIRTIGYLNLCQFGDANQSLGYLENIYPKQKEQIKNFIKSNKSHYQTLLSYLQKGEKGGAEVAGLPSSVIREMGRDRDYLEVQQKLNNIVDEIPKFKTFVSSLMGKREKLKKQITSLAQESQELKSKEQKALQANDVNLASVLKEKRKNNFEKGKSVQYQVDLFNKGLTEYKTANINAEERAKKLRDDYLAQAENVLRNSMGQVDARLDLVLRNNDLLRYEVYANSGKNIRYRVAGGKLKAETETTSRAPASVEEEKSYGWKFKGEFWEDEIGNFRSELKNLCPQK